MNVEEYVTGVRKGEISVKENIKKILNEAKKINKEYNYFNVISDDALTKAEEVEKNRKGKLAGLPISVKDCVCVKGMESRAGSLILKGYKPVINATVIERLEKEGAIIIGKTSQDEFGFGSFSTNTDNIPKNPLDKMRSCGGSSGGAAGFTRKTENVHAAIAESTGGSIACPASFCGVAGLTPTYGVVSRYGLIDYANSLDKIGIIGKNVKDTKLVFDVIKGKDERDSTSVDADFKDSKVKKIAVIKESLNVDKEIKEIVLSKVGKVEQVSLPLVSKYALSCYYLISMSEASTNLAKYCGLRYGESLELNGNFNEYFSKVRSKFFTKESKRRIILGTFARMSGFRDAYYLRAMKLRTLIIEEYKKLFREYDILVSPTMPIVAPKFSDIKKLSPMENYMMDILTVGPNLAGLPHLSVNIGTKDKMPVGLMLIGDHFAEEKLTVKGEELENRD